MHEDIEISTEVLEELPHTLQRLQKNDSYLARHFVCAFPAKCGKANDKLFKCVINTLPPPSAQPLVSEHQRFICSNTLMREK